MGFIMDWKSGKFGVVLPDGSVLDEDGEVWMGTGDGHLIAPDGDVWYRDELGSAVDLDTGGRPAIQRALTTTFERNEKTEAGSTGSRSFAIHVRNGGRGGFA